MFIASIQHDIDSIHSNNLYSAEAGMVLCFVFKFDIAFIPHLNNIFRERRYYIFIYFEGLYVHLDCMLNKYIERKLREKGVIVFTFHISIILFNSMHFIQMTKVYINNRYQSRHIMMQCTK